MKSLFGSVAVVLALLHTGTQAVPVHYKLNGTVQQAAFDPASPFPFLVGPGAEIVGRVNLDTSAADLVPDDPNVGAYRFARGPGAPYFLELELHQGGGMWSYFFDTFTVGVVNGTSVDQYTLHAQRGDPAGLADYAMLDIELDYHPATFGSDRLPATPPAVFADYIRSFTLTGAINRGGQLYQYELIGQLDAVGVPEPGTAGLVLLGATGIAAVRRRRALRLFPTNAPKEKQNG